MTIAQSALSFDTDPQGAHVLEATVRQRKYKVFVEGRNFLISVEEERAKHAFYTCRFVEAADPNDAETAAVAQLRARQSLREMTLNTMDDPPMLYVTDIVEIPSFDGLQSLDQGLIWFRDDGSSDNAAVESE